MYFSKRYKIVSHFKESLQKIINTITGYPLVQLFMGFLLGIILHDYFSSQDNEDLLFIMLILLIFFIIKFKSKLRILIIVLLGVFLYFYQYNIYFANITRFDQNFVDCKGEFYIRKILSEDGVNVRLIGTNRRLECIDISTKEELNFLVNIRERQNVTEGKIIEWSGTINSIENKGEFDYSEYMRTKGVVSEIKLGEFSLKNDKIHSLEIDLALFKRNVYLKFARTIPEPHLSILLGMVMGYDQFLPQDFSDSLSFTSTTHIIAVSGFNVNLIITALLSLKGFVPKKYLNVSILIFLVIFSLLVGLDNYPAMRASIAGFALIVSYIYGRKGMFLSLISLSIVFTLLMNPIAYKTLSFQLSYASTLGLYLFGDIFKNLLKRIPEVIADNLAATLCANISTMIIIIPNFHKISLLGPIVNVIVLPFVPLITLFGFVELFLSIISDELHKFFGFININLLNLVILPIKFFSKFKQFYVDISNEQFLIILIIIFILFLIYAKKNIPNNSPDPV